MSFPRAIYNAQDYDPRTFPMALSDMGYIALTRLIEIKFKTEIAYYARNDVAVTTHAVGAADKFSWTDILFSRGIISALPSKGDRYVELERTLTVLYSYFLLTKGDRLSYESFISAQLASDEIIAGEILTEENFDKISQRLNKVLAQNNTDENAVLMADKDKHDVLIYLIIYSDLGKSPRIKELLAPYPQINVAQDSDGLMTDILKLTDHQITQILPSFAFLSNAAKAMLRETYPLMNACQGHIFFLERGEKTFAVIANALLKIPVENRENALNLVNLSQFLDAMGAQGQRVIFGAFNCTRVYAIGYELIDNVLQDMRCNLRYSTEVTNQPKEALSFYLDARAAWLGFDSAFGQLTSTQAVLTRLGCALRGVTPQFGEKLVKQYQKFEPYHTLLETQLGFGNSGLEGWKAAVHYIATTMLNMSRALSAQANIAFNDDNLTEADRLTSEAIFEALKGATCFAMLLEHIFQHYPEYVSDPGRAISFGPVAGDANDNPAAFNPETFDPKMYALNTSTNKVSKSSFFMSQPVSEAKTAEATSSTALQR